MIGPMALMAAALVAGAGADAPSAAAPLMRHQVALERCRVTALSEPVDRASTAAARAPETRNAFLLQIGGHRVLIGPAPAGAGVRAALATLGYRPAEIDTVIVTSLDDKQASGILDGGQPAYPAADLYVDRWAADRIAGQGPASAVIARALDAYRAKGRLHLPDFDLDILPGIRMAVTSDGPRSGSVRVRCGKSVLIFWTSDLRARDRATPDAPAAVPPDRQRFLEEAVARDYLIATGIGPFPGLGHVYRLADGFHWGSIEARSPTGTPMRRGQIYIEPGADLPVAGAIDGQAAPPPK